MFIIHLLQQKREYSDVKKEHNNRESGGTEENSET
jgi:hypothetical protein